MATQKTETSGLPRAQPVRSEPGTSDKTDAEVVHSRLQATDEPLTLDDSDFGGDPYNSTGRFTALDPDDVR